MKHKLMISGVVALLGLLLTGCESVNAVTEPPEVEQNCTASDIVDVQVYGTLQTRAEALGVSEWSCLKNEDKIRYLWRRPQRAVAARNEVIVSMDQPGRWRQSFTFRPDGPGTWTLEVYRNDRLAQSAPFNVK